LFYNVITLLTTYIYLLHKYDWCHVIDTVIQLYMIVGLGIRLKWISVRSWRWTSLRFPRKPVLQQRYSAKWQIRASF